MNTEQAISEAGRVWRTTVAEIPGVKSRIRSELEARIEHEVAERRRAAARAIYQALDHGASKAKLRKVTTSDHYGFESYVDLGRELAQAEQTQSSGSGSLTSQLQVLVTIREAGHLTQAEFDTAKKNLLST